jgi:glutamine amidotransferase
MIVIIDYSMGNIGSIANMFKKIGVECKISSNPQDISSADKLILPGVGAYDNGMKNLSERGFIEMLNNKVMVGKTPILGICLGMQLFSKSSEEGQMEGLGWIDAETVRFSFGEDRKKLRVPHMGWNEVQRQKESVLFKDINNESRFYFVHSYHVICNDKSDILTTTCYGFDFVSAVEKENIYGVQFHPEKSHKYGMKLLKNFAEL